MDSSIRQDILLSLNRDIIDYAFPGLKIRLPRIPNPGSLCDEVRGIVLHETILSPGGCGPAFDDDDSLDPRTLDIIEQLKDIKERYNLTDDDLDRLLGYTVKLSRLRIAHSGKIYLEDFKRKEVKMDSLSKAVFFLFLRHPEGIDFKRMGDYRDELGALYFNYSGKEDNESAAKSLDMLCSPLESNSINEKVSRIKHAFLNAVSERVARHYYISGKAGEPKTVLLDRTLVDWD